MYFIKELERAEVADIYAAQMSRHFPKEEIKPLESIYRMWDSGAYFGLAMWKDSVGEEAEASDSADLVGYALFVRETKENMLLLDYFAIMEQYRSQGMGSVFLKEMKEKLKSYKGILIETEDVEWAKSQEELQIRQKRDAFYQKNGVLKTGVKSRVYGVNYAIWNYPLEGEDGRGDCKTRLESLYKLIAPGEKYEKYVEIWK